jgi:hypothetical protein
MITEARETDTLIGSDKVAGTSVYGPDDQAIGTIEQVMIEKPSGRVSYAVLGFGGFLGIGNDHYPLPWNALKYDTNVEGYRIGITLTSSTARRNTLTKAAGIGRSPGGLCQAMTITHPRHPFHSRVVTLTLQPVAQTACG